ncbi:DNA cytosine methyltransferase [Streptomyces thinghirensis]|nr:DNA cytosine methyltransferase [Streptomyces thinghirensis]
MGDQPEETKIPRDRTSVELFAGGGGLVRWGSTARGSAPPVQRVQQSRLRDPDRQCRPGARRFRPVLTRDTAPVPPAPGEPAPLYPGDVRKLDLRKFEGEVDVLAGGPPRQPFSAGGVAKGDEDKRNMFPPSSTPSARCGPRPSSVRTSADSSGPRSPVTSSTSKTSFAYPSWSATPGGRGRSTTAR